MAFHHSVVVVSDFLLLAVLSCWYSWKFTLAENGLMAIAGLAVIFYYQWRWSEAVANRIESEPTPHDGWILRRCSFWSPESYC